MGAMRDSELGWGRSFRRRGRLGKKQARTAVGVQELRALADASPVIVGAFHSRQDGSICMPYVSPNIEQLFGLRPRDVIHDASPLMALSHPEDAQRVLESIAESARHMTTWHEVYRILHPSLGERWMEGNSHPQPHPDGGVIWYGYVHDVTERQRAEMALRKNFDRITQLNLHLERQARELTASREQTKSMEAWYRNILRSAPDGMLVMDRHGVIVQANAQVETLFGYDEKELVGQSVEMLVPASLRDLMASIPDLRGRRKDGSEFPADISLSQLCDGTGSVQAVCAAIRDITERKRLEGELIQRERAFRTLAENSPDPIYRYDRDCRRLYVNPVVEKIIGKPVAELIGSSPGDGQILVSDQNKKLMHTIRSVFDSGETAQLDLDFTAQDGQHRDYHMLLVPERDASGQVATVLAMARDITQSKLTETALRKSRDMGRALAAHQESEREKERRRLAYEIHEELAQNFAALRMHLALLEMGGTSATRAPVLQAMHGIAECSIARIRDMVSKLRPAVLDLGLVSTLRWLTDDFKGVGLAFTLSLQEDILLHDEATTFLYRAAKEALLNTALHASATRVHVSLGAVAGMCCMVVRDNGCGFDPAAPRGEGCFGLAGLAEGALHLGGELFMDSTPGYGATLEIRLPLTRLSNL